MEKGNGTKSLGCDKATSEEAKDKFSSDSFGEKRKVEDGHTPENELQSKKPKMVFSLKPRIDKKPTESSGSILMKVGASNKVKVEQPAAIKKPSSMSVAKAFNDTSDSEEEEMPPEAKMRMRNIGRNTPTSAGPNSFGKTRQGFCDVKKVFERDLKRKMEELSET